MPDKETPAEESARIHREHGERKRRARNAPAVAERRALVAERTPVHRGVHLTVEGSRLACGTPITPPGPAASHTLHTSTLADVTCTACLAANAANATPAVADAKRAQLIAIASKRSNQANEYTRSAVSSVDHVTAAEAHDKAAEAFRAVSFHESETLQHERNAKMHRDIIDAQRSVASTSGFAAVLSALVVADDAAGYTHHQRAPVVVIPRELWTAVRAQLAKVIPAYPHAPRFVVEHTTTYPPHKPSPIDLYRDTVTGIATGADFKCSTCKRGRDSIVRIDADGVLCECGRVTK